MLLTSPLQVCHLFHFQSKQEEVLITNRLTYFDMNDFDEAILGPATWDLWRFLASALVGTDSIGLRAGEATRLGTLAVESFQAAMRAG